MRTYDDSFSGQKIYPGKGKLFVRGDSKIFRFQNGKSESLFLQRKNPRRIAWTVLFRRQHKKGISEVGTAFFIYHWVEFGLLAAIWMESGMEIPLGPLGGDVKRRNCLKETRRARCSG
ncbi:ribosomal protein L24e-domain-containing protein [Aspergillus aurantiobrunneus]